MRLLFISDNFPPEVNAPATRTYEHCKEWVKKGVEVTVITCAPNFPQGKVYSGYRNKLVTRETVEGIKVIRVWSYITSNQGFLKRTLDYLSFAITAFFSGLFVRTDLIIATSPQFFSALGGRWLSFFKRRPWIMEVRDLWPESIKTVGALKAGKILDFFEWLELRLYRSARVIVSVTDSFKANIASRGIAAEKIKVIKNGANLELYRNQPKDFNLKMDLGLNEKFVVGYIGTHGMAHKLDFILDCAASISNKEIHFLFVGDGAKKAELIHQANTLGLENVSFHDPISKDEVWKYISILDVMVVPLKRSELFKTVIPSKIFETAAMGIPILLGVDGEAKQLVENYGAGLFFEPENKEAFLKVLEVTRSDSSKYLDLRQGCKRLAMDFDRKKLSMEMLSILESVAN